MKRLKTALICFLLLLSVHAIVLADTLTGRVVRVSDGDSLTVLDDGLVQHKVRLAGIDAPEKRQAFGQRAKQSLAMLCFAQNVTVEIEQRDRYGRLVGQLYVAEVHVNLAQVESGMAWVYRQYLSNIAPAIQQQLLAAEAHAQAAEIGLWRESEPVPPWVFRRRTK